MYIFEVNNAIPTMVCDCTRSLNNLRNLLLTGASNGAVNQLSRPGRLGSYTPKFPFPTECHSYIDAALATDQGEFL